MTSYDRIGAGYDRTRRADPYLTSRLLAHLDLPAGAACLDIACGTGNYTAMLAAAGLRMTGVDASTRMLRAARAKVGDRVTWLQADAAWLPLADRAFDGAICTLALHHFVALEPVFREARRVVRGGRLVLFTSEPRQTASMWLRVYFPALIARAAAQMPPLDVLGAALRAAGFGAIDTERYEVTPNLQDQFLYSGKHRPELYLDPQVRAGISSFATAPLTEVAAGVEMLAQDIESGRIAEVMREAQHDHGDYLFIIAGAA